MLSLLQRILQLRRVDTKQKKNINQNKIILKKKLWTVNKKVTS